MSERSTFLGATALILGVGSLLWTTTEDFSITVSGACLAGTCWFLLSTALLRSGR